MNKKLVSLLLALVMLCAVSTAFASKGFGDLATATVTLGDYDTPLAGWSITLLGEDVELAEEIAKADSLSAYFKIDLDGSLELVECWSLAVEGYVPEIGDVTTIFTFPTSLSGTVVALIGVDGVWTPVKIEVVDGSAQISFPSALLAAMNGKVSHIAILMA